MARKKIANAKKKNKAPRVFIDESPPMPRFDEVQRALGAPESQPRQLASETRHEMVSTARIDVPAQEFHFGGGKTIFPEDRPICGSDILLMKREANFDLNMIESTLGISRRDVYYELVDKASDKLLPEVSMAILMRLYEAFPKQLLPFQPLDWAAYLTVIGVHPGEFAQLVGRAFTSGRDWQEGSKPIRSVQLIIEAFARAGVTDTGHPVYQKFLEIAQRETDLRSRVWLEPKSADEDNYVRTEVFRALGEKNGAIALSKLHHAGTVVPAVEALLEKGKYDKKAALDEIVARVLKRDTLDSQLPPVPRRRKRAVVNKAGGSLMQPVDD